ncbi:hypothetical protein GGR57DRAFT_303098 [Xylariaceae sp. FL1272]|nr:hypothetical protein GGR57DRAFT_303098 [Xylariaceae sp. FL1272]
MYELKPSDMSDRLGHANKKSSLGHVLGPRAKLHGPNLSARLDSASSAITSMRLSRLLPLQGVLLPVAPVCEWAAAWGVSPPSPRRAAPPLVQTPHAPLPVILASASFLQSARPPLTTAPCPAVQSTASPLLRCIAHATRFISSYSIPYCTYLLTSWQANTPAKCVTDPWSLNGPPRPCHLHKVPRPPPKLIVGQQAGGEVLRVIPSVLLARGRHSYTSRLERGPSYIHIGRAALLLPVF